MKKSIKLLSLLIVAVMLFSLAACNGGSPSDGGTSTSPPASGSETPAEIPEIVFFNIAFGGTPKDNDEVIKQAILEGCGVSVTIAGSPWDVYKDKLSLMLSGAEQLDAYYDFNLWPEYSSRGAIIPINGLLDQYGSNIKANIQKDSWNMCTDTSGQIWGVPIEGVCPINFTIAIRQDWLTKLGMAAPTTMAELEAYFDKVLATDLNGNGQNDEIPIVSVRLGGLLRTLAPAFTGAYENFVDTDGKLKPIIFHPKYRAFIETLADWYSKGYIYRDIEQVVGYDQLAELASQDRVGTMISWWTHFSYGIDNLFAVNPDAEFITLDPVEGPAGRYYQQAYLTGHTMSVTKSSKNPEAVIKFIDWCAASAENQQISYLGPLGVGFNWNANRNGVIPIESFQENNSMAYAFVSVSQNFTPSDGNYSSEAQGIIGKQMNDLVAIGGMTVKDAILGLSFDQDALNAVCNQTDLTTFIEEQLVLFITGQQPISNWDKFTSEYLSIGGQAYIDERTSQYDAMK